MEPKLNRRSTETANKLLAVSVAICIISVLLAIVMQKGALLLLVCALAFVFYAAYRHDEVSKCPHCGTPFRGVYISAPNAGYCRKCGKLMEFDEDKEK